MLCADKPVTARGDSQVPRSLLICRVGMRIPEEFDRLYGRLRLPQTLTVREPKNGGEIRLPNLPRNLRQPSANSAEDAADRLPCPNTVRQVAFHGLADRHAGVPGAQHRQFIGVGEIHGARFG
jgi:hypothetical protein